MRRRIIVDISNMFSVVLVTSGFCFHGTYSVLISLVRQLFLPRVHFELYIYSFCHAYTLSCTSAVSATHTG